MTYPDPKPLASLSGSLLARKGQAAPAMRRQNMAALAPAGSPAVEHLEDLGWDDMGHDHANGGFAGLSPMAPSPVALVPNPVPHHAREDAAPADAPLHVEVPPVVQQQRELINEFAPAVQAPVVLEAPVIAQPVMAEPEVIAPPTQADTFVSGRTRAAPGSRGKAAFTLRLDSERHLKLRVVCALRHRSAQQIVTEALDAYLAKQPIPADLAERTSPPATPTRGIN
jgi:hypothetical protein